MFSAPAAAAADFISGVFIALIVSALSRLTIGRGVPVGARRPNHDMTSNPASPASAIVGTSGSAPERFGAATPSAFNLPLLMLGWTEPTVLKSIETSPPTAAAVAGGPPLYGTWTMLMPVMDFNNSPHSWCVLPLPADA